MMSFSLDVFDVALDGVRLSLDSTKVQPRPIRERIAERFRPNGRRLGEPGSEIGGGLGGSGYDECVLPILLEIQAGY